MKLRFAVMALIAVLFSTLAFGASDARALEFRNGDVIVIGAGEVIDDDVYVSATSFTLDGTVKGDLIVFARTVQINGIVEGDLAGAAQSVTINGVVKDDVRIAGAVITLAAAAQIGDDVLATGGSIETQSGSMITGELNAASSQALLAGDVNSIVRYGGSNLSLRGRMGSDVYVNLAGAGPEGGFQPWMLQSSMPGMPAWPVVPAGLTFGEQARIAGEFEYSSQYAVAVPPGVTENPRFVQLPVDQTAPATSSAAASVTLTSWLLDQLRAFVTLIVIGFIVIGLAPRFMPRAAQLLASKPLPSLGWGFALSILVPVGAFVLFIVGIGIAVAFGAVTLGDLGGSIVIALLASIFSALVAFGLLATYATQLIVAYWLGRWLVDKLFPAQTQPQYVALLVGLAPTVLLVGIPTVGWLLWLAATWVGLGTLWLMWRDRGDGATVPNRAQARPSMSAAASNQVPV